jgi:hypothetical protein
MGELSNPDKIVALLGIMGLLLAGFWRLILWVREAPLKPDPWDAEVERTLWEPEAVQVCHHCLTPQNPNAWFCKHCGSAVGPYNNLMPYLNAFSEGEVFRNGVTNSFRRRPVILIGYFLISLAAYSFFAPIYWLFLLSNLKRPQNEPEPVEERPV